MQKTTRSTNSTIIAEAISTLNSRIEKTESDFISHLQKVEDRLDKIVDIAKTVALLQQQSNQHVEQISEIRTQLRETVSKIDSSIGRINARLDEMNDHQRDKLEIYSREIDIKIDAVSAKTDNVEKELKQWLNRGWGAWAFGVLIFGVVQTGFYRWIDGIEKERETIVKQLSANSQLLSQYGQSLENVNAVAKEAPTIHKRLEQMTYDNERQIEILRQQISIGQSRR